MIYINIKKMIEVMEAKGYWTSPGGKTPHATLCSAVCGIWRLWDAARFVRIQRGRFAVRSYVKESQSHPTSAPRLRVCAFSLMMGTFLS